MFCTVYIHLYPYYMYFFSCHSLQKTNYKQKFPIQSNWTILRNQNQIITFFSFYLYSIHKKNSLNRMQSKKIPTVQKLAVV